MAMPRAKHGRPVKVYGPHMKLLAAISAGDITPGEDQVQNALTECTLEECVAAVSRICRKQKPEIRTPVSTVLGTRTVRFISFVHNFSHAPPHLLRGGKHHFSLPFDQLSRF